ncbi:MAG: hypothetical protein JKY17_08845 [Magnetovibrio sp.]|nr:hypothetical protein [Magnetovibrio sp.]
MNEKIAADLHRVLGFLNNRLRKAFKYHSANKAFAKLMPCHKIYTLGR